MTFKNNRAHPLHYVKLCASFQGHWWIQTGVKVRKCSIRVKISNFFVPCDLEIWRMTLKNNWAPLLYYLRQALSIISKPSVYSNWSYSPETINSGQNRGLFAPCDLEIWWVTIGHLFYATSRLVHHFTAIGEFKLEFNTVLKRPIWVKINDFFVPCDLEIWQMTLKNNRAPLLSHIKHCASFHCHMWIQTGVTVRKPLRWVLTCDLDLWPLTMIFCMDITSVSGCHFWKFHDDTMMGT